MIWFRAIPPAVKRPLPPALLMFCVMFLGSCGVKRDRSPAIGEVYAGPANLTLRKDIDPKSPAAGVVHHGAKLDVLSQRRRWYRVRSPAGEEGWTDDRQLLDKAQMRRLRQLAKETADLPSQGAATSFGTLNIHTEPNRQSPSFVQVKEGDKLEIIAHRVLRRGAMPKRQLVEPKPKQPKRGRERKKSRYPEPDPPPPPRPPSNWLALSRERGIPVADIADEQVPQDDWTLVRVPGGQSGWVLTGRLFLAIPDEVAQYAEGHRITSYFSLGKVQDEDRQKNIWLWTTVARLGEDHDFDGYRVFVWSLRRHRYETAFIQRRIQGFFPVLAKAGDFSVCIENDGGQRTRKMYSLIGNSVKSAGERPCEAARTEVPMTNVPGGEAQHIVTAAGAPTEAPAESKSWVSRAKDRMSGWFHRK